MLKLHKIFVILSITLIMMSGLTAHVYAKDYRLDQASSRYTAKVIRAHTKIYENPRITAKIITELKVGDLLSIVASYDRYYAFKLKNQTDKKFWLLKENVKLYTSELTKPLPKKQLRDSNSQVKYPVKNEQTKSVVQNNLKPLKSKHQFGFGAIHFKDIDKFDTNQWGAYLEYERFLHEKSSILIIPEFLHNELFNAVSVNVGFRYLFWSKLKSRVSSSVLLGGESLFASDRSVTALNAHASLVDFSYQVKPSFKIVVKPLQLRMMMYNDQNIPINYRYAFSLGVQF